MALFTIQTNRREAPFGDVHLLIGTTQFKEDNDYHEIVPVVLVRYHYGRPPENPCPYDFTYGFYDMGSFVQFISFEELAEREQAAQEHGQKYEGHIKGAVAVYSDIAYGANVSYREGFIRSGRKIVNECKAIEAKSKAIIDLDIFRLPITL